ncbi:hypothetical protein CERSUDRAFT_110680 [Gelatoporia subvermispora B]|uniref:Uncharacterized protein n=1 Tax=Ceriporiopsis subvermispora (strain B) TaxID=914234 RepID=M2RUJ6_CERS8|nr:hypothetical protein CERSUDRAFT_110680 [Gelatoporia subvermispora B]
MSMTGEQDMDMDMELVGNTPQVQQDTPSWVQNEAANPVEVMNSTLSRVWEQHPPTQQQVQPASQPERARDIVVKVHIRRPEKDSWAYLGRGIVSQEQIGQSTRIIVKSASTHKIMTVFGEGIPLQAERRGNFIVIGCVDGNRVVSWSLNALNNSDTLRLLASIELACCTTKHPVADPRIHAVYRRRIARIIKDDRKRRHKRRRDQDALVTAFARTALEATSEPVSAGST